MHAQNFPLKGARVSFSPGVYVLQFSSFAAYGGSRKRGPRALSGPLGRPVQYFPPGAQA